MKMSVPKNDEFRNEGYCRMR